MSIDTDFTKLPEKEKRELEKTSLLIKKAVQQEAYAKNCKAVWAKKPKTSWWRFPAAIISFCGIIILVPVLIALALALTNYIIPNAFKRTALDIIFFSDLFGAILGFNIIEDILQKRNYIFQMVFAILSAIYFSFVAIVNMIYGASTIPQFLGVSAMAVTSIVFAVKSKKKHDEYVRTAPWAKRSHDEFTIVCPKTKEEMIASATIVMTYPFRVLDLSCDGRSDCEICKKCYSYIEENYPCNPYFVHTKTIKPFDG